MAKKSTVKNFSDVTNYIVSLDDESSVLDGYTPAEPTEWIHTGNYLYNAHISGSLLCGLANNSVMTIAGDPKTGKSFLGYNLMRYLQFLGYTIYYFETEHSLNKKRMINHNLDPKRIVIRQPEVVDDIIIPLTKLTNDLLNAKDNGWELPKIAIFIDSITALNSIKQFKDAESGVAKQDMGTVAKDLKRLFTMMTVRLGKLFIPWVNMAHVYEKDMGHFRKRTPTGGNGALFMSTVISMLKKNEDKDKDTKQRLGIYITSEIVESRYSKPYNVTFKLSFEKGMNPYYGLHEFVSWDTCGIDKGKFVDLVDIAHELLKKKVLNIPNFTQKHFTYSDFRNNLSKAKSENLDGQIEELIRLGYLDVVSEGVNPTYKFTKLLLEKAYKDGEYTPIDGKVGVVNKGSNNYIVRHLGVTLKPNQIFNGRVFTLNVLMNIDEKVIRPIFEFNGDDVDEDIDEDTGEIYEDDIISQHF
jgi:RecA/RadA recombinase